MAKKRKAWLISELSLELGYDRATIRKRIAQHNIKPAESKGAYKRYYMRDVVGAFLHGEKKNLNELNRDYQELKVKEKQMELDVFEGQLLLADDLQRSIEDLFGRIRARILSIPAELAPQAVGGEEREIRLLVDSLLKSALTELGNFDYEQSHNRESLKRKRKGTSTSKTNDR